MTSDNTEQKQDTSQKGDSSVVAQQTSTEIAPETLTQEQVIEKAVNDALSAKGRDAKSLSELKATAEKGMVELREAQAVWQKQKDAEEEARFADDMPALIALRAERKQKADEETKKTGLTEQIAKADARDAEFADIIERDKVLKRTELAAEVAVDKKVNVDLILKGVALSKDDSRAGMEAVAELLPQVDPLPSLLPHSPGGQRGGIDVSSMTPEEKRVYGRQHPDQKMT